MYAPPVLRTFPVADSATTSSKRTAMAQGLRESATAMPKIIPMDGATVKLYGGTVVLAEGHCQPVLFNKRGIRLLSIEPGPMRTSLPMNATGVEYIDILC